MLLHEGREVQDPRDVHHVDRRDGPARLSRLTSAEGFSFCRRSDCPGVYFSSEWDGSVKTGDVAVRVAASAGRGEPCWLAATMRFSVVGRLCDACNWREEVRQGLDAGGSAVFLMVP